MIEALQHKNQTGEAEIRSLRNQSQNMLNSFSSGVPSNKQKFLNLAEKQDSVGSIKHLKDFEEM